MSDVQDDTTFRQESEHLTVLLSAILLTIGRTQLLSFTVHVHTYFRSWRAGHVCGHMSEQRVAASTLRQYSFGLRLPIDQADARPAMPVSFKKSDWSCTNKIYNYGPRDVYRSKFYFRKTIQINEFAVRVSLERVSLPKVFAPRSTGKVVPIDRGEFWHDFHRISNLTVLQDSKCEWV